MEEHGDFRRQSTSTPRWEECTCSTVIYRVPTCVLCTQDLWGGCRAEWWETWAQGGGRFLEGLSVGWKKSLVFINSILSKALEDLFGDSGLRFSQARGGWFTGTASGGWSHGLSRWFLTLDLT